MKKVFPPGRASGPGGGGGVSPAPKSGSDPSLAVVGALLVAQSSLFRRRPWLSLSASAGVYAAVVLGLGPSLAISSNYFVILPVLVAALAFGLPGGLAAGCLGLPANLGLFALLGHPEYSPASKLIAEVSGLTVGFFFGALSDYFQGIEVEMSRRRKAESELREALAEKEVLLAELNHRVRNNLGIVKALLRLQQGRSDDPRFLKEAEDLAGRIFAIALVHDDLELVRGLRVRLGPYLSAIASRAAFAAGKAAPPALEACETMRLPIDAAVHTGLIANEVLAGLYDDAADGAPTIRLERCEAGCRLVIEHRRSSRADGSPLPDLGRSLIRSLAASLSGQTRESDGGGTYSFELVIPSSLMEGPDSVASRAVAASVDAERRGPADLAG